MRSQEKTGQRAVPHEQDKPSCSLSQNGYGVKCLLKAAFSQTLTETKEHTESGITTRFKIQSRNRLPIKEKTLRAYLQDTAFTRTSDHTKTRITSARRLADWPAGSLTTICGSSLEEIGHLVLELAHKRLCQNNKIFNSKPTLETDSQSKITREQTCKIAASIYLQLFILLFAL